MRTTFIFALTALAEILASVTGSYTGETAFHLYDLNGYTRPTDIAE